MKQLSKESKKEPFWAEWTADLKLKVEKDFAYWRTERRPGWRRVYERERSTQLGWRSKCIRNLKFNSHLLWWWLYFYYLGTYFHHHFINKKRLIGNILPRFSEYKMKGQKNIVSNLFFSKESHVVLGWLGSGMYPLYHQVECLKFE